MATRAPRLDGQAHMSYRQHLIRDRHYKVCQECKEVFPSVCRVCNNCRDHCTCWAYDKVVSCTVCEAIPAYCTCEEFSPTPYCPNCQTMEKYCTCEEK